MRQMFGLTRAELREHDLFSRGEWNYRAADSVQINVGLDLEASTLSGYYVGSRPPQAEGGVNNGGVSTEKIVDASSLARVNAIRPGLYTEFEWRPLASLVLVPAIRIDHYTDQDAWTFDPRLACRYELTEELRLKWGLGIYSQNPQYYELLKNLGNPKLSPYHAQQFSTGFEHHPDSKLNWGIEGFYKNLTHRVVATNGGQKPYFVNDGTGRIYGVELFTQYTGHRLRGWLAYTLSRSERRDRNDAVRLFEADQTHILAITANYELGRGWELGSRFRVTSGNPYTPVTSAVYDANVDVYQPVNAKPFSARNPPFHQLDVRIEKTFSFKMWKLSTYLDVQNAYNAKNYQGFDYSYNYGERRRIEGLSLIPNLGVRGEI
jgi:outer membrane receptor for ferrienterochelin and colicin